MGNSESKEIVGHLIAFPDELSQNTDKVCNKLFCSYDANGDEALQFDEASKLIKDIFSVMYQCMRNVLKERKKREGDKKPYSTSLQIYEQEVKLFKKKIQYKPFLITAFAMIDTDASGEIDYEEFKHWFIKFVKNSPKVLKDDGQILKEKFSGKNENVSKFLNDKDKKLVIDAIESDDESEASTREKRKSMPKEQDSEVKKASKNGNSNTALDDLAIDDLQSIIALKDKEIEVRDVELEKKEKVIIKLKQSVLTRIQELTELRKEIKNLEKDLKTAKGQATPTQQDSNEAAGTNRQRSRSVLQVVHKPFLVVTTVNKNSPAHDAQLQVLDQIKQFGPVTYSDIQSEGWGIIKEVAMEHENKDLHVTVLRHGKQIQLKLHPRQWEGEGILGCTLDPYEI